MQPTAHGHLPAAPAPGLPARLPAAALLLPLGCNASCLRALSNSIAVGRLAGCSLSPARAASAGVPPSSCSPTSPPVCGSASAALGVAASLSGLGSHAKAALVSYLGIGQLRLVWCLSGWKRMEAADGRAAHPACQSVPAAALVLPSGCSWLSADCCVLSNCPAVGRPAGM